MKSLRLLVVAALLCLGLVGCKSTEYRWVTHDGLPGNCNHEFVTKHYTFHFCLVPGEGDGEWYVEGVAEPTNLTPVGDLTKTDFFLYLVKDGKLLKKVKLYASGKEVDKGVLFYKNFSCDEKIESVAFGYSVGYRY